MTEIAGGPMSLQSEFEGSIQAIHRDGKLHCFHILSNGNQCGNKLGKATRTKLTILFKEIIELLENGSKNDVETLLKEASLLVMCLGQHRDKAGAKFEEWSIKIPARRCKPGNGGNTVESLSSTSTVELLNDITPMGFSSEVQIIGFPSVEDPQRIDRNSNPEPAHRSCSSDFDDSGYQSSNEETLFQEQATACKTTGTTVSSALAEYAIPQTPQKAAKPVSTDSGISLSFDRSDEPKTQSTKYRDGSESPLARKSLRSKPGKAGLALSRPAPTPIQPISLPSRPKSRFVPFGDPFAKLRSYIAKPLVVKDDMKDDMKEGYIYGFQLEGCAYTKIGSSAARTTQPTVEASLDARMDEHEKACWPGLKLVLKKRVPFVRRVEKIIQYHLEAGRMKEQCSCCKGSNGRRFDHGNHIEWFNNSLDEIYAVVIAWKYWILSMPYTESYGGRYNLSSEWRSNLEDIRNQSGRDNWLEWLCKHVPELSRRIQKTPLDAREWIENDRTAESRGSFVRDSATGVKVEIKRVKTCL